MRLMWVAAMVVGTLGGLAMVAPARATAQEQPSIDEMNRKYTDALNQLKVAQDRKNELATENEALKAQIAKLTAQLADANRDAATWAEQTFHLRVHYAAWQAFIRRYPLLLEKWKLFVESDPLAVPTTMPDMLDPTNSQLLP